MKITTAILVSRMVESGNDVSARNLQDAFDRLSQPDRANCLTCSAAREIIWNTDKVVLS